MEEALQDGIIDVDEAQAVAALQDKMNSITSKWKQAEAQAQLDWIKPGIRQPEWQRADCRLLYFGSGRPWQISEKPQPRNPGAGSRILLILKCRGGFWTNYKAAE